MVEDEAFPAEYTLCKTAWMTMCAFSISADLGYFNQMGSRQESNWRCTIHILKHLANWQRIREIFIKTNAALTIFLIC